MNYRPFVDEKDLPAVGPLHAAAQEREHLDFKAYADPTKGLEHAKDIAAFANSLGGTILVGVTENNGVVAIPGVAGQSAAQVKDIYEHAALRSSPKTRIDAVIIARAGAASVVAVNVPPFAEAPIGVPGVVTSGGVHTEAPNSWRYPIRRASQTEFLTPEQLPMYMNPATRRAYVRLSAIPLGGLVRVDSVHDLGGGRSVVVTVEASSELHVRSVSIETNALELGKRAGSGAIFCRVPLIDVVDVWEHEAGKWAIRLRGRLEAPMGIAMLKYTLGL